MEDAFRTVLLPRLDAASWLSMQSTCRWARAAGRMSRSFVFGPEDAGFVLHSVLMSRSAAWAPHDAEVASEMPWDAAVAMSTLFRRTRIATVSVVLPDDDQKLLRGRCLNAVELSVGRRTGSLDDGSPSIKAIASFARRHPHVRVVFRNIILAHEALSVSRALPLGAIHAFESVFSKAHNLPEFPRRVGVIRHLHVGGSLWVREARRLVAAFPRVELNGLRVELKEDSTILKRHAPLGVLDVNCTISLSGDERDLFEFGLEEFICFANTFKTTLAVICRFHVSPGTATRILKGTPHNISVFGILTEPSFFEGGWTSGLQLQVLYLLETRRFSFNLW